jgi:2-polyprenyl-3-methyl-5-hydroxy-6-metoxy-1,4-benzoquinol methylase
MVLSIVDPWDKDYEGAQLNPIYEALWKMLRTFLQSIPVKPVLDFGCGDGNYSFLLKEMGFQVTGIDVSARAIEKAKAKISL